MLHRCAIFNFFMVLHLCRTSQHSFPLPQHFCLGFMYFINLAMAVSHYLNNPCRNLQPFYLLLSILVYSGRPHSGIAGFFPRIFPHGARTCTCYLTVGDRKKEKRKKSTALLFFSPQLRWIQRHMEGIQDESGSSAVVQNSTLHYSWEAACSIMWIYFLLTGTAK